MKRFFRLSVGFLVVAPYMLAAKLLSLFIGPEKSITFIGPYATNAAKNLLRFWVPQIDCSEDFDNFSSKMKMKFWLWRPFYDIEIKEESDDVFQLKLENCPFCEVLNNLGFEKLSPYVCEGDWEIAKDNQDKWLFDRSHQIGTGDKYCNHTYMRIKE